MILSSAPRLVSILRHLSWLHVLVLAGCWLLEYWILVCAMISVLSILVHHAVSQPSSCEPIHHQAWLGMIVI